MDEKHLTQQRRFSTARKVLRVITRTVLIIILIVASIALLILTPPAQNLIRKKAQNYLTAKLQTRVEVGRIYIGFPKKIVLEDIYVEDRKKDTLLSGGKLQVDISMLKLINSEIEISQITLSDITAKIKRVLPDTAYNFQFIIDAFASGKKKPEETTDDSSSMTISVRNVMLDKIRLVYDDVVTGNDLTVWLEHFDTRIDKFDLANMNFEAPHTRIKGLTAKVKQKKPLLDPLIAVQQAALNDTVRLPADQKPLQLDFGKIQLNDIQLDYDNEESALYADLSLGALEVNADKIDLVNRSIALDDLRLGQTNIAVRLAKTKVAQPKTTKEKKDSADLKNGWRFFVKNIDLRENNIDFNDENKPAAERGMDYAHLGIHGLTLQADDFLFAPDSIKGSITKGEMIEKSGFQLIKLQTDFLYAGSEAYLHELVLETPGTKLHPSIALHYPSINALQKDIGSLQMNVDLKKTQVQVKDILTFAPFLYNQPAFANPSAIWVLSGKVNGTVSRMRVDALNIAALGETRLDVSGVINGLPDAKKLSGNLSIKNFHTSKKDIQSLVSSGTLPANITIPNVINLRGALSGNMSNANANLDLNTDLGSASVNGTISQATDKKNAKYNARITATRLQLGVIMQNDSLFGPVTAAFTVAGKGFDPKTANARIEGTIQSVVLNRYNYRNVQIKGTLANEKTTYAVDINDPNIRLALQGKADISGKFPTVMLDLKIDSIKTQPLHFTNDALVYHGRINADFPVTDPSNLRGRLDITQSLLSMNGQRYSLDSIALTAGSSDTGKFVRLKSEALQLELTGVYDLAQIGAVVQHSIEPYYSLSSANQENGQKKPDSLKDYDFNIRAQVVNGPLLKVFMPTLLSLEPVTIQGRFASGKGFQTALSAPLIVIGTNRIEDFKLNAATSGDHIRLETGIAEYTSGENMAIYGAAINARIADNKVNFLANIKDKNARNKYRLGGIFGQPNPGSYNISFSPDSLMLNYQRWSINEKNLIRLNQEDLNITQFVLSKGSQQLSINSTSQDINAPLEIKFGNFRIGTVTAFAKQDSLLADGTINGQAIISNVLQQPTFTSDLTITDLLVKKDTVGNVALKVNNTTQNVFNASANITGKGNDVQLKGNYYVKPANQSVYDLNVDIRTLQMTSIQALSMGAITRATGHINGRFDIKGTFEKPDVNGNLNFNKTGFSPTILGSYFSIDGERIDINKDGFRFNNFTIKDSAGNDLNLHGTALTSNFINYRLNLDLTANNFQALNSEKQNNKLFYGKFYFDTDLHIKGTEANPVIDGNLTINDNTKFTLVLPQEEPGVADREGIIRFIDADSLRLDSTILLASYDSIGKSELRGFDVSVNIEINKNAELTLIIDESNGDFLRMKGTAQLNGGVDPSGKTTLTGVYEIEEGSYELSFNFLKRKFDIQKGSKITWLGEPTKADVNLTAVYTSNTAPLSLVENQIDVPNLNIYKQRLPFQVNLKLTGQLLKPDVAFDIVLPDKNYNIDATVIDNVDTRLTQLRTEPSELNKQVFALLLLNRFVSENPFAGSGGGGGLGSVARQSVSKILTEQLNSLASDLIKGVDLNFDLESSDDYTTGNQQNRTDLNVSLSKELLNDRLKVTVGSNFELEGPQNSNQKANNLAGNVALDYLLSKDGRYLLRAYRKNEYEGELDGYIIETGVNFIITLDYDHFRELFHLPRQKTRKPRSDEPDADDSRKAGPVEIPGTK